jgi:hypothetical protein
MRVMVRLSGSLAERLGNRLVVELVEGARARDLLDALAFEGRLGDRAPESWGRGHDRAIQAPARTHSPGDEVDGVVPVAGG